jgi:hypothetical protein
VDLRAAALADGIGWLKHPTQIEIIGMSLVCVVRVFMALAAALLSEQTVLYKKLSQLSIVTMSL